MKDMKSMKVQKDSAPRFRSPFMSFMLFMVKKIRPPAAEKTHHRACRPAEKEKGRGTKFKGTIRAVSVPATSNLIPSSTLLPRVQGRSQLGNPDRCPRTTAS
jgi:hypothetical protein